MVVLVLLVTSPGLQGCAGGQKLPTGEPSAAQRQRNSESLQPASDTPRNPEPPQSSRQSSTTGVADAVPSAVIPSAVGSGILAKWEYMFVNIGGKDEIVSVTGGVATPQANSTPVAYVNSLGDQGWELVSYLDVSLQLGTGLNRTGTIWRMVFKRPKP